MNKNTDSIIKSSRAEVMRKLANIAFDGPVKALEIGVWYATGSTNIWLENFREGSEILLVDSWRPYSSVDDVSSKDMRGNWDYNLTDSLTSDAFLSSYLRVKKFEQEVNDKDISLIRAKSKTFLKYLSEGVFDFIYIDADHKYDNFKEDLINAKRLINKNFGVICGDDLEKNPTSSLINIAKKYKNRDYLSGDLNYHPGVCLAISEQFHAVNMIDGFWWVVCKNGEFTDSFINETDL